MLLYFNVFIDMAEIFWDYLFYFYYYKAYTIVTQIINFSFFKHLAIYDFTITKYII